MSALKAWNLQNEAPTVPRRPRPADLSARPEGERRAARRLPIEVDVDVEGAAHRFRASTVDLSPGGLFVSTQRDIPEGTHVMLGLSLPSGAALEVIGIVRWRRPVHDGEGGASPGLGIAFFCLDPEVKKTLEAFCAVREPLYAKNASASSSGSGEYEAVTRPVDSGPGRE